MTAKSATPKTVLKLLVGAAVTSGLLVWFSVSAHACGGFFCQNQPVDQIAERIVFTVNDDGTISSLIEIAYQGAAEDFSWILPIPEPISADDVAVPDDGDLVFDELHRLTDVSFVTPRGTECTQVFFEEAAMEDADIMSNAGVEVFASGEVGPFGFDVIGADDPTALISWLTDNNYVVESSMEPLINVYVEEEFSFIAMRLLDGETAESIQPVEITYAGTQPMIPIRLTAVAAFPEMPIYTWIFADEQAVPENYAHFEIRTEELTFTPFGANNYQPLVQLRADAVGGRGFITEFAGPADGVPFGHPYLVERAGEQPYLTRLFTYLDPEEMLVDPVFGFDANAVDVSQVRDASQLTGLYDCERFEAARQDFDGSQAIDPLLVNAQLRTGEFTGYDDPTLYLDPVAAQVVVEEPGADPTPVAIDDEPQADPDSDEVAQENLTPEGGDQNISDTGLLLVAVFAAIAGIAIGGVFYLLGRQSRS